MTDMVVEYWHWWVLGTALLILEIMTPGAFMLWLGIAAGIVGTLLLIAPDIAWEIQLLIFAVLSVASIAGWRAYRRRHPPESTDEPTLNRRGAQYVGRVFTLEEPIVNGYGKLRVDDTTWKVSGADLPGGARVRVIGVDNTVLAVASEP